MARKMSQFDGSLSIDSFASTFLVFGAAVALFAVIVGGLVTFQSRSDSKLQEYETQSRRERQPAPRVDILGPNTATTRATSGG
jgi:cell division protein FtsI/penicillin-binding protein 2